MSKFTPEKWTKPYRIKDGLYVYALKPFNGRYPMREVVNPNLFYTVKTKESVVFKDLPEGAQKEIKDFNAGHKTKQKVSLLTHNEKAIAKGLSDFIREHFTYASIEFLKENKENWELDGVEIVKDFNNKKIDWSKIKNDLVCRLPNHIHPEKMLEKDVMYSNKYNYRNINFDLEAIRSEFIESGKLEIIQIPVKIGSVLFTILLLPTEKLINELYNVDTELNYGLIRKPKRKAHKTAKKISRL